MKEIPTGTKLSKLEVPKPAKTSYPSVYLSNIPGIHKIPDSGYATIKHKVVSRSSHQNKDGDLTHSIEMEIHSIRPHSGNKKKMTTVSEINDENSMHDLMNEDDNE